MEFKKGKFPWNIIGIVFFIYWRKSIYMYETFDKYFQLLKQFRRIFDRNHQTTFFKFSRLTKADDDKWYEIYNKLWWWQVNYFSRVDSRTLNNVIEITTELGPNMFTCSNKWMGLFLVSNNGNICALLHQMIINILFYNPKSVV